LVPVLHHGRASRYSHTGNRHGGGYSAIRTSVPLYFMVDFEAAKTGMRGMRKDEAATKFGKLIRQCIWLFPIVI